MINKKITLITFVITLITCEKIYSNPFPELKFHGTEETLSRIVEIITAEQKGAYLRFGDGDVNLALGKHDALQTARQELTIEMQEAFLINGPTILKTLPLYCKEFNGYELGMSPGNHEAPYEWCLDIIHKANPLWGKPIIDVYSHAALHFASSHKQDLCIQFLKFLKKSPCYMFVGNTNIPVEIRELLFGKNCIFISTPPQQSYNAINAIEKEVLSNIKDNDDYKIIITAMGCSGRALQKRLWNKLDHVFLFDFGSVMDALCGWNTRAWIEITQFNETNFIEHLTGETHVVCTAALLENDYEARKQEYILTLENLHRYGLSNPYIIESINPDCITFLNSYSRNVIYPNVNNPNLRNKGVNEARALAASFKKLPFKDNDMIIKVTGRYFFTSDKFLKTVESHPTTDAFFKMSPDGQVYTGCYAIRYKLFKEFLDLLDYEKMEREMINIEQEMADYLEKTTQTKKIKVMYLEDLGITANIWGNGHRVKAEL